MDQRSRRKDSEKWKKNSERDGESARMGDVEMPVRSAWRGLTSFRGSFRSTRYVNRPQTDVSAGGAGEAKKGKDHDEKAFVKEYQQSNPFSRTFLSWASGLVYTARRREVDMEELWEMRESQQPQVLAIEVEKAWVAERTANGDNASFRRAVTRVFYPIQCWAFFFMMGWLTLVLLSNAVLLVALLDLLENPNEPTSQWGSLEVPYRGFYIVLAFFFVEMFRSLAVNKHWELATWNGISLRGAALHLLFQKLSRLRRNSESVGQLLNIVSSDVERLRDALQYSLFIFTTPVTLIAIIILGYWLLGPSIFAGFVVLILSVPFQTKMAKLAGTLRRESAAITDRRVKMMLEILNAAQLIKLYAWEEPFQDKIARVRAEEIVKVRRASYVKSVNTAVSQILPVICCFATFAVHTLALGKGLEPAQAFAVLSMFNIARFPLNVLPLSVRLIAESLVGMRRIGQFLCLEELEEDKSTKREAAAKPGEPTVSVEGAVFSWGLGKPLRVDKISIGAGIYAIVGSFGSGKSSFLGALLGELELLEGSATLRGSVAYVGQNAWVFNASVRDNIVLGRPFDRQKFDQAVKVCALGPDLDNLPNGPNTEIGEKGINLSGGQKIRVALARAVYSDADVYLLDDVLSAVDVHVGATIWKECIETLLREKTVVMATHSLRVLPFTDKIFCFQDMQLVGSGSFDELQKQDRFLHLVQAAKEAEVGDESQSGPGDQPLDDGLDEEPGQEGWQGNGLGRPPSNLSEPESSNEKHDGALISAEDRTVGSVTFATVKAFVGQAGGVWVMIWILFLFLIAEGSKQLCDVWLAYWTEDSFEKQQWFYNVIYGTLGLVTICVTIFKGVVFFRTALKASRGLHDATFASVMRAKLYFFHVTPLGRILARFSSDVDKIDTILVDTAEFAIGLMIRCILSLLVICIILPAFLAAILPLALTYAALLNFTRKVVRQFKRIDNISRSPLVSQFQSVATGITSVRAYNTIGQEIAKNVVLVDNTSKAYFAFTQASRWVAVRIDFITTFIVSISAGLCVIFNSVINPGLAGLVLVSALQTAGIFQFATRQFAELEAQFTSVERLRYFIENTPQEQDIQEGADQTSFCLKDQKDVIAGKGLVEFDKYSARYRPGLPLVLKSVSMQLSKRCALVGRSGSGKSSTLLALFRVLEPAGGKILIDGVDAATIPLAYLRSKILSIVPQDPSLFAGTLRYNLDPFDEHSDEAIWDALEKVHLAEFVREMHKAEGDGTNATASASTSFIALQKAKSASPLGYQIEQGGLNLSAGQRQLLCFARALLRGTPIICLDEALSSVDENRDKEIKKTLDQACEGRTLIVIAHRLSHLDHFDKILVMDRGRLAEQGSPQQLIRQEGIFAQMWRKHQQQSASTQQTTSS